MWVTIEEVLVVCHSRFIIKTRMQIYMIETKQTLLYKSETCLKTIQCSPTTVSAPTSRPVRHNISQGTFVLRARRSANVLQTDTLHRTSGCKIALVWSSYYLEHRSPYMYVLFTAVNATVKSTRPWNIYFTYKFVRVYVEGDSQTYRRYSWAGPLDLISLDLNPFDLRQFDLRQFDLNPFDLRQFDLNEASWFISHV